MFEAPTLVLDIGGTKIAGGILDEGGRLTHKSEIPTLAASGGEEVCRRVCGFASEILAGAKDLAPKRIGVSAAGVIDSASGSVVSATDLMPGWCGIKLAAALREATGLEARVLNDVHAHALGELHFGAGRGHTDALVIAVGTGIGGAIISAKQLLTGANGLAGHLGHTTYLEGPYLPCSCGRSGHIEAIASGSGVTNLYNLWAGQAAPATDGFAVYQRAMAGDEVAVRALDKSAAALGQALANLANCFDPNVIILSGSMTRSGDIWWQALARGYREQAMDLVAKTPVVAGELGGDAPLLGAAVFAAHAARKEK